MIWLSSAKIFFIIRAIHIAPTCLIQLSSAKIIITIIRQIHIAMRVVQEFDVI